MSHDTVATHKNTTAAIALNLGGAGLLAGLIIALVYFVTAPVAAQQRIVLRDQSMKALVPTAEKFVPIDGHTGWFAAQAGGTTAAYLVPGESKGYGGSIKLLLAANPDGTIIDYKVLSHNETPGLGDRTTQPKFRKQFAGKKVEALEVVKTNDPTKIDAITGVTISSRAITKGVREALEALNTYTATLGGSQ